MASGITGKDGGGGAEPFFFQDVKSMLALLYVQVRKVNVDMCRGRFKDMMWRSVGIEGRHLVVLVINPINLSTPYSYVISGNICT